MVTAAVSSPLTWSSSLEAGNRDCWVGPGVGCRLTTEQPGVFVAVAATVGVADRFVAVAFIAVGIEVGRATQAGSSANNATTGIKILLSMPLSKCKVRIYQFYQ